jgi:hypothetical protein
MEAGSTRFTSGSLDAEYKGKSCQILSMAPESIRLGVLSDDVMIRKLKSGEYRLYSGKIDLRSGKRRNLGTFPTRAAAEKHEREVQYFKRH